MNFLQKPSVRIYAPQQDPNVLRVKNIIKPGSSDQPANIGIIGVPFDKAVSLGGGRDGARHAPAKVREALKKYGTTFNIEQKTDISDLNIVDFGDVTVTEDIAETHERITAAVDSLLTEGTLPIVIGGGHDISIGTVRALSEFHSREIGGMNIDAHFDVREMSKKVSVFTLSEVAVTGTAAIMQKALKIAGSNTGSVFVSIDIDSVAQCFAPGCRAPDARGFSPESRCI
jgi:arginase family enzyme